MNHSYYEVVIGNGRGRYVRTADTIKECQLLIRKYIEDNNIGGIYGYGYDDEGYVYLITEMETITEKTLVGRISYNGRFWPEQNYKEVQI